MNNLHLAAFPNTENPFIQAVIKNTLSLVPKRIKPRLYELAAWTSSRFGCKLYHHIFRLPFGLVLKISDDVHATEAHALRFVAYLGGIRAPSLVDYVSTSEKTYMLSTWIDGDCCADVWEQLTASDKDRIAARLRSQFRGLRAQTSTHNPDQVICRASGVGIRDPRLPWLIEDKPRVFASCREFLGQVWIGLDFPRNRQTLLPLIKPLIERSNDDLPIVFCHGDLLPKNIVFPGGLEEWRSGRGAAAVYLIDWEYAGWMPLPLDPLKATWLCFEPDDDWLVMMKTVFPESQAELDADWEWRSRSNIPIV